MGSVMGQSHEHGINSDVIDSLETCIVHEDDADIDGAYAVFPLWGRDGVCRFECDVPVHVRSTLMSKIKHYGEPKVIHKIVIDTPDRVEVVLWDCKDIRVDGLVVKTVEVSGRVRALRGRVGYNDSSAKTIQAVKCLGNALKTQFGVRNTDNLTNIRNVDGNMIQVDAICPYCHGRAVYRYNKNNMQNSEKKCNNCGWTGYLDIYDGDGSVVSVPLTTSVRNLLKLMDLDLKNEHILYEKIFDRGLKPSTLIRKLGKLAREDYREAQTNVSG